MLGLRGLVQEDGVGNVVLEVEGHCKKEGRAGLETPIIWPHKAPQAAREEETDWASPRQAVCLAVSARPDLRP